MRPLGSPALKIIRGVIGKRGSPYLLPAERREGPYRSMPRAIYRIITGAELPGVTAHTLRHSFASVAGDLGFTESTIGAMLGHAAGSVTGRYVHHLDSVLIAAADKVARTIHGYMTGEVGKVVQMPGRRVKS